MQSATSITSGLLLLQNSSVTCGGQNQSHSLQSINLQFGAYNVVFLLTFSCINGNAYFKSVIITSLAPSIPHNTPTRPPVQIDDGDEMCQMTQTGTTVQIENPRHNIQLSLYHQIIHIISLNHQIIIKIKNNLQPAPSSITALFLTNSGRHSRYFASSNDPSHTLSPVPPSSTSLALLCLSLTTTFEPAMSIPNSSNGKKLR